MAVDTNGVRSAPSSPSVAVPLGAGGLQGAISGVTRIGSRAGLIAVAVLAAIVLAIIYGISSSGSHRADAMQAANDPQILPTTGPLFGNIPGADPVVRPSAAPVTTRRASIARQTAVPVLPDPAAANALRRTTDVPEIAAMPRMQMPAAPVAPVPSAADVAAALKAERQRQMQQIADSARHAAIMVSAQSNTAAATAAQARIAPIAMATATAAAVADAAVDPNADPAIASQRAKNEFIGLQKSTTANDYLTTPRQASISPYEVQAGSIIPAILVTGINSDLPGTMIGQVSQNVYDSKTGTFLLIPAGSKLVGRYDSQVTNGQSRVLVAWQRILFPDSSFIDINGMAGADTAGYSGLTGKVDDHSGKLFRNAILFSLIGAGAALLQPRTAVAALTPIGMVAAPSVGSQVAGQVGSQLAQTAQAATQKGLQQQPTIEVRPGYLFNIMVDRDLVLPGPYAK